MAAPETNWIDYLLDVIYNNVALLKGVSTGLIPGMAFLMFRVWRTHRYVTIKKQANESEYELDEKKLLLEDRKYMSNRERDFADRQAREVARLTKEIDDVSAERNSYRERLYAAEKYIRWQTKVSTAWNKQAHSLLHDKRNLQQRINGLLVKLGFMEEQWPSEDLPDFEAIIPPQSEEK